MIKKQTKMGVSFLVKTDQYRVEWPFPFMKVGDILEFKGENAEALKVRAVSAANHYKLTRGMQFRSKKIHSRQYIVWRSA